MFKLTKIINSPTNVPEIIKLPYSRLCDVYKGHVYACADGNITKVFSNEYQFACFMPIENVKMDDEKDTVSGFFITSDMIFECNSRNDRLVEDDFWLNGYFAMLDVNTYGGAGVITNDSEFGIVHIIDISEYDQTGWFTVKFNI